MVCVEDKLFCSFTNMVLAGLYSKAKKKRKDQKYGFRYEIRPTLILFSTLHLHFFAYGKKIQHTNFSSREWKRRQSSEQTMQGAPFRVCAIIGSVEH